MQELTGKVIGMAMTEGTENLSLFLAPEARDIPAQSMGCHWQLAASERIGRTGNELPVAPVDLEFA